MLYRDTEALNGGILFRALLSGMMDVRPSKQQQNGRITYNIYNTSRDTILNWFLSRKSGHYLKKLIHPTWAEKLGFTPARGTPTTSKKPPQILSFLNTRGTNFP